MGPKVSAGSPFKKAVLFVNLNKKNSKDALLQIKSELEKRKIETTVFSLEGKPEPPPGLSIYKWSGEGSPPANPPKGEWDIAFSLGGDGTVLYTARCLAPYGVPILPVNLGALGFIAGVSREKWIHVFHCMENGEITPSRRCMLEISIERNSKIIMKNICLNDVVVSATGIAKLIRLGVSFFSTGENAGLGSYRCDGLIIATPTGSTAYSMAAGGPILDPEMEAVILNPICPFTLSSRPLVLPSRQALVITVAEEQRSNVLLTVDGQDTFNLECSDRIIIQQAPWPALLIFADRLSYYSALRTKLSWSGDVSCNANGGSNA